MYEYLLPAVTILDETTEFCSIHSIAVKKISKEDKLK